MIVAAHQPQYLAWLGYYHKMARCDAFVYLDEVQYKKREFQNRNRIKSAQGELWLTVPVVTKGRYSQKIREVEIDPTQDWAQSHWLSLTTNYSKAAHFGEHADFFEKLYRRPWARLMPLCLELDEYFRARFGIASKVHMESEIGSEGVSTARLISICKRLGADAYLSGQGGKGYLDEAAFEAAGVMLIYQELRHPRYPQRFGDFMPNLSAVDALMNCGSEEFRRLLA